MYNNDSDSLDAGAYANLPQQDIRLSGDQTPQNQQMASMEAGQEGTLEDIYYELIGMGFSPEEAAKRAREFYDEMSKAPQQNLGIMASAPGTYTQNRKRQMAAGGGIMGSNNGSMLVAPTADGSRPGYADWWNPMTWVEPIKEVAKKVGQTIIPGGETGYFNLYGGQPTLPTGMPQGSPGQINPIEDLIYGMPQGSPGQLNPYVEIAKQVIPTLAKKTISDPQSIAEYLDPETRRGGGPDVFEMPDQKQTPDSGGIDWRKALATVLPGGDEGYVKGGLYNQLLGRVDAQGNPIDPEKGDTSMIRQIANIGIPLAAGKFAHDYQRDYLAKQPKFPMDDTGITFQTARQAMDDPNLRFKPKLEDTQLAAEGGRIGYAGGGSFESYKDYLEQLPNNDKILELYAAGDMAAVIRELKRRGIDTDDQYAQGGRIGAEEGGLMNLGGMEKDYRQEGGFVPIGGKEKADDVPARLSKNEFVFTADAVRAAGGGDIDQGAEVMENVMKNLEAGGEVSEESQGLEGARGMFANAQQLEKRII